MPFGRDIRLKLPAMINTVILFVIFVKLARQIVQNVLFISITLLLSQILPSLKCIMNIKVTTPPVSFRIERRKINSLCIAKICEDDSLRNSLCRRLTVDEAVVKFMKSLYEIVVNIGRADFA